MSAFQMWRDYFQMAQVVTEMARREAGREASPQGQGEPAPGPPSPPEPPCCSFCKQNGESPRFYASHDLKDRQGRVQCPVLRRYVCPQCGASGDRAHTRRFCPLTEARYVSVYTSGRRNSAGRKRRKASGAGGRAGGARVPSEGNGDCFPARPRPPLFFKPDPPDGSSAPVLSTL